MAYLYFSVGGSSYFGGYVSVDGNKCFSIKDGTAVAIDDGLHAFQISTVAVYGKVSGGYNFQASLNYDDVIVVEVVTRLNEIISTPTYHVKKLSDFDAKTISMFNRLADEKRASDLRKREEFEESLKPRRSKPKIIVGSILTGLGALGSLIGILTMAGGEGDPSAAIAPMAVFIIVGLILLLTGLKKKVRY